MADSQDLSTMWQLRLMREADDCTSAAIHCMTNTIDVNSAPRVVRVLHKSADDLFILSSGLDPAKDSRQCLGEITVGNGAAHCITRVIGTCIKPQSGFKTAATPTFALQKSTKTSKSMVYLRPGDEIYFEGQRVTLYLEPASSPVGAAATVAVDAATTEIEVRSSGHEIGADEADAGTETEDDDNLFASAIRPESQATVAPFSTARSTLQAVQETPKAERTAMLPEEAEEADEAEEAPSEADIHLPSPKAEVLKPSRSAVNRGPKRAAADGEAALSSPEMSSEHASKRHKTTEEPSSSRRSSKLASSASRHSEQTSTGAESESSAKPSTKPTRVVFSGIDLKQDAIRFLKKQKITIANDLSSKVPADSITVCCVPKGKLSTTAKVLMALVHNYAVVTFDWVEESQQAGEILDPAPFWVKSLPKDVDRSILFTKRDIYFTQAAGKSYAKGFSDMIKILMAAGSKKPTIRAAGAIDHLTDLGLVIGLDKNDEDAIALLSKGERVHLKELLNSSILQGELLDEDPSLQLSNSEAPAKKGRKKN